MRLALTSLACACALALGACGDTVQQKPIPHNILETLVVAPSPVYWLGASFNGMALTEATHDPGGAYSVVYGNCLQGGQGTCVAPLRIVSSPDNGFLPGTGAGLAGRTVSVRGQPATVSADGRTIVLASGPVVIDVYAANAAIASAAARTMVPINAAGSPGQPLPARLPDTRFGERPLPSQLPSPLAPAA